METVGESRTVNMQLSVVYNDYPTPHFCVIYASLDEKAVLKVSGR